jgi:hypothetical protein
MPSPFLFLISDHTGSIPKQDGNVPDGFYTSNNLGSATRNSFSRRVLIPGIMDLPAEQLTDNCKFRHCTSNNLERHKVGHLAD